MKIRKRFLFALLVAMGCLALSQFAPVKEVIAKVGGLVEESDGDPSGYAVKIKFPNGSLSISGGVATYNGAGTMSGDITLDDGVTDSPAIKFVVQESDQTAKIYQKNEEGLILHHDLASANGYIALQPGNDDSDYVKFSTVSDVTTMTWVGQDGKITADGGDISFDDENISTSGTATFGSVTTTAVDSAKLTLDQNTANDTDWYIAIDGDSGGDDDDNLQFRTSATVDTQVKALLTSTGVLISGVSVEKISGSYTLGTNNEAIGSYGVFYYATSGTTVTLAAVAEGMAGCLEDTAGNVVYVDPNASDLISDGSTDGSDGEAIQSSGTEGDKICWLYFDATGYRITSKTGTWKFEAD